MYLRNVLCVGSKDIDVDSINKKLINFNDNWTFCCLHHVDGSICVNLSYDFNAIICDSNKYSEYKKGTKEQKEIAKISLMNYKYKILTQLRKYDIEGVSRPSTEFDIYRIPRTFTIAYNDTHFISASMRANLYALYWLLECKDVMRVITEHLFNVIKYDYSLYVCAN